MDSETCTAAVNPRFTSAITENGILNEYLAGQFLNIFIANTAVANLSSAVVFWTL